MTWPAFQTSIVQQIRCQDHESWQVFHRSLQVTLTLQAYRNKKVKGETCNHPIMMRTSRGEEARKKISGYYREECNKIASFYDLGLKLLCLPLGGEKKFRKGFVDFIGPTRGEYLLDVCCGTGTLSIMIAEEIGSQGLVVGVDLSPNMIRIARQKGKNRNVEFVLASAELLPIKETMFNKAICSFGLHEMTRTGRGNALREINRVLKKNGRLNVHDLNLPKSQIARLIGKVLLKLAEEKTAYNMIFKEKLWSEIKDSEFKMRRFKAYFLDALQMISAENERRIACTRVNVHQ